MAIHFYYVRHGETLFNVIGRSQGACDSPLTPLGIKQAEKTGELLRKVHFDRVYSSSSERAFDTAELILKGSPEIPIIRKKGLKEMFFGTLEASGSVDGPAMGECWARKDFTEYGGENREILEERIRFTFYEIVRECEDGDNVLIVSHRGYFYYMLEALFGWDLDEVERKDPNILVTLVPNASVARFDFDDIFHLIKLPSTELG
ncbi:MAG: histidine phosphatase family protein [Oscillospiraceae bacterium]|nr:histidine phosphatase family protein [Oscillospiraceae bacterium]